MHIGIGVYIFHNINYKSTIVVCKQTNESEYWNMIDVCYIGDIISITPIIYCTYKFQFWEGFGNNEPIYLNDQSNGH